MKDILTTLLVNAAVFSLLFGLMLLVRKRMHKKVSAVLQYTLWALLVIKLIMPFGFESSLSPISLLDSGDNHAAAETQAIASAQTPVNETGVFPQAQSESWSAAPETESNEIASPAAVQSETAVPQSAVTSVQPSATIDWIAWAFAVWAAGFITTAVFIIRDTYHLRRNIYREQKIPSQRITHIFESCKRQLGVKKKVKVLVVSEMSQPMAMSAGRSMLVLPEDIEAKSDEQIRYICMHELTHIKHGDLFVLKLLNILCAVYWFNPLVWVCFSLIRKDMETACDARVLAKLGNGARLSYIGTVLHFAGCEKERRLYAAMGMADGRLNMEQRIRSMYKKERTGRKTRAVALGIAVLILTVSVLTACQPTPEKPIVQSKDNETVADAINQYQSTDQPEVINTFSAPETWQSQARDDVKNIDVHVDATLDVPTDTWGLYELVPQVPTFEDVQTMLTALVGDAIIYGEQEIESKEDLLVQITRLEAQKAEFEQLLNEGGLSEDEQLAQEAEENGTLPEQTPDEEGEPGMIAMLTDEELQSNIEIFIGMINEAREKLPNAPDEPTVVKNEFVLADMFNEDITVEQATQSGFTYSDQGSFVSKYLNGTVDMGKQDPADIHLDFTIGEYNFFSLNFADYDDYEHSFGSGDTYTGQELFKCDISMEEAAEIAREKVREMGFDYLDIDTTCVADMLDRKRKEGDKLPECFKFVFSRSMDGATTTFAHGDGVVTDDEMLETEYAPSWDTNEVSVYVDDSGVVGVRVDALKSDVVRQAFGIELMAFEQIMDIFETQLFIKNAFSYDSYPDSAVNRELHIDEIRLGYMPTAWKDHAGQIIFTPVWDFFGYEIVTYEEGTGAGGDFAEFLDDDNKRTYDLKEQSLLTINALDGTIMNRQ